MLREYFRQTILLDQRIFLWINQKILCPFVSPLLILITELGSGVGTLLVGTVFLLVGRQNDWKEALKKFYFSLASAGVLALILKKFFHRLRPVTYFHNLKVPVRWIGLGLDGPSSFPSGHSLATGVLVFVLSYYFPRGRIFFWLWGLLVMFSRVYIGAHFPLDVLGGFFTGFGLTWLLFSFIFRRQQNVFRDRQNTFPRHDE